MYITTVFTFIEGDKVICAIFLPRVTTSLQIYTPLPLLKVLTQWCVVVPGVLITLQHLARETCAHL